MKVYTTRYLTNERSGESLHYAFYSKWDNVILVECQCHPYLNLKLKRVNIRIALYDNNSDCKVDSTSVQVKCQHHIVWQAL